MPTSTASNPPVDLRGYMDEGRFYALSVDFAETVGDMIWPASIPILGAMRNDPALGAILAAYTLPIRRATWAVDPAGCQPEVAQLVADDLGLPVLGDDTPGAARTRGVSWSDHLRTALMYLVYGHAGFEMLADTSTGQARLVGLYERVPHTISFIHSTPNGDFGGVSQMYHPDSLKSPEILPQNMVWYCHNREGSAWHGRSLLRGAYAPWLLKREMQRVLATSSRRFGMGVPVMEALPGANVTPEQMQAAQQMASASRVGDQAGAATPPNFAYKLVGLSGSVPDTLAFIKWLDQQMSKMALAQFLDLGGESSHGSRALGTAFIDMFTLSIAAVAEELADQVTRQAAARIVEWNWGLAESVPRVVVTDVGTKHEFTADAIQQLMQAGALQADPALEEYLRKAYQLPQRDPSTPWVPMVPTLRGRPHPAAVSTPAPATPAPVAAAAKPRARSRRAQAAGQTALPIAAAGDDPAGADQFQQDWVQSKADVLAAAPVLLAPLVDDLATQVEDHLTAGDVAALATVAVGAALVASLAAALLEAMNPLSVLAAGVVVAGAAAQGKKITAPKDAGVASNADVADVQAQLLASSYAQAAARRALLQAGPGADPGVVAEAVRTHLDELATSGNGLVADVVGGALSAAQAAGRRAVFEQYPPKRWVAHESNDTNACQPCKDADLHVFQTLAEVDEMYGTFGLKACLGGPRCRGHVWPEWV